MEALWYILGFAFAGVSFVFLTIAAAWLVSHHDWRTSMQLVALVVAVLMIPAAFLVRRPHLLLR